MVPVQFDGLPITILQLIPEERGLLYRKRRRHRLERAIEVRKDIIKDFAGAKVSRLSDR